MKHKPKTLAAILLSTALVAWGGIASYADAYTDNSSVYVYDEETNPNGNVGLISYYDEASADTDTMKAYIDAGDTYFANQLSLCRTDVVKGKNLLRSALVYKGVSLPENPTYAQITQGIANIPSQNTSGTMTITAHFHLDGVGVNKTFTDNDTQTAWQQYNAYLNSHNTNEKYSTQRGCYTVYHYHTHSESCKDYRTCYTRTWTESMGTYRNHVDGQYDNYPECNYIDGRPHVHYRVKTSHSSCGKGTESSECCTMAWGDPWTGNSSHSYWTGGYKCGIEAGAYYSPSCGKTNGQILKIDVAY